MTVKVMRVRLGAIGDKPRERLAQAIDNRRATIAALSERLGSGRDAVLRAERVRIATCRERVAGLTDRARRAAAGTVGRERSRLGGQASLLASLGYRSVLARGYALVRDSDDAVVRNAAAIAPGQSLTVEFADGVRRVQAEGQKPRRREAPLVQTSLFDN